MQTEARNLEKRLLVTRKESNQMRSLMRELEDALDCGVVYSSFMRALMRLAVSHHEFIVACAEECEGELHVPQRGDEEALVRYENSLAEIMHQALVEAWDEEMEHAQDSEKGAQAEAHKPE